MEAQDAATHPEPDRSRLILKTIKPVFGAFPFRIAFPFIQIAVIAIDGFLKPPFYLLYSLLPFKLPVHFRSGPFQRPLGIVKLIIAAETVLMVMELYFPGLLKTIELQFFNTLVLVVDLAQTQAE